MQLLKEKIDIHFREVGYTCYKVYFNMVMVFKSNSSFASIGDPYIFIYAWRLHFQCTKE